MRIDRVLVEMYENEGRGGEPFTATVTIETPATPLGGGTWLSGRAIRLETRGPGTREHVQDALAFAFDRLEKALA